MEGSPQVFWDCETKTIDRIVIPQLSNKFWNQSNSETQTGPPTMICGDVRQKSSTKLWYPFYRKTFDTRIFLKDRMVRPRCFSATWDKKISTEKRDTPFLSIFFSVLENFWNTKAFPTKFFGTVRLNLLDGKSLNSYFMHKVVVWLRFYESLKGSPQKIRHRETKKFKKVVIDCYPKFFRYQNVSELQGSPYEVFWYCEIKTINKIVIPVLSKKFWNQNNSETQTGSPTMICGDVRQKSSTKLWYPFYRKTFDTRIFLKDRMVRPRCFSAIWDKKISTEKRDTPFLSIFFFLLENFWNTKAFPTKSFGTVRLKLFDGKSLNSYFMQKVFGWHSFYEPLKGSPQKIRHRETKKFKKVVIVCCPKFLSIPKDFWITRVLLQNFFVLWDKNDQQNCDTPII